jgi:uncharacterized circularly permuted ATP-grasp superfamily protein/uncharacterized alpha-E superfamily protein
MKRQTAQNPARLDAAWPYAATKGFYDEVLAADEELRPQWRKLGESLATMGHTDLARRWHDGRRLIHDNGITYNIYSDPQNNARPWQLDPIPLVMDPEEWKSIEAGIIQRALLFNTILADLYGPQRLLREDFLPRELVFPNPAFLRSCWGIVPQGGVYLHSYAADLARSPDGQWWVLADRTQAPSGAGYALENRLVTSRVMPDVFRASHVRRLANYFQTYRNALLRMVPVKRENPRIVVLTPGPYNETYFEHAFLARYLGYTLVEGGDLTVRENHVFLKTLGGLLPVDVIVRRQDDHFCDPLELRGDSMLGVPGLVQAVRSGTVSVANALGSGLAESPAYAAFLPGLCKQLLGEELKMPTVATWWCGQEAPFEYVEKHLEDLVIKPTFPGTGEDPIFAKELSAEQREKLLAKMRKKPGRYVAQEQVALSTVPVWDGGSLQPRHLVMRVFAVTTGKSYSVMPGGLTRISASLSNMVVSMQRGGGSKDTWVLGDGPAPEFTLLRPPTHPLEVSRATFDLPSRVADNLFWLGRYTERVEAVVRIVRAILGRVFQEGDVARAAGLNVGLHVLRALGFLAERNGHGSPERELVSMMYDPASGLASNIHQVRRVAWLLRDRISVDAWLILNQLDQQFSATTTPATGMLQVGAAQDRLNHAVITLSAFSGLVMEGMTRGDGWRFLDIGRRLERALQMAELLRNSLTRDAPADVGVLEAVLEIADSSITYRSRYLTSLQTDLVVDLLLVDEANPRSIAFQLARLQDDINQLPASHTAIRRPLEARLALSLLTGVQLADVRELVRDGTSGPSAALESLFARLITDLIQLSETLTRAYFSHSPQSRQLAAP